MSQTSRPVAATVPLSRVLAGERRVIVSLSGSSRDELEREGLLPGSVVVVRTRTPLGGPIVVELGRTRLALSMDVARRVSTTTEVP